MQVYHSMTQAARGIVQRDGVRGLYTGLGITLVEIVPYAALQFGLYDTFTVAWSKARRARLQAQASHPQIFCCWSMQTPIHAVQAACGMLTGACLGLCGCPALVLQLHMRGSVPTGKAAGLDRAPQEVTPLPGLGGAGRQHSNWTWQEDALMWLCNRLCLPWVDACSACESGTLLSEPAQCVSRRVQQGSGTAQQQVLAGCCLRWRHAGAG